ncbi:hypothetical protein TNCV_757941 [Trichonephila clavipes]|nr:hypothetical protein TNCV_757941 [Trichonephila clavipes]
MFAIAAISSRQTIVNKYLQNNKGVNWNGLTVDDFVVVVCVAGFVVEARVKPTFNNPMGSRTRGRPPTRWIDDVENDIKTLNIKNWQRVAAYRLELEESSCRGSQDL